VTQSAFDLGPAAEPEPVEVTYGVGELTGAVNSALRRGFPDGAWVRGEISGLAERGPHLYFRLVEETEKGRASLDVSFFAPSRTRLRGVLRAHGLRLADGLRVRIHGSLDVFAPTGRLSLKMDGIDPRHTLGDLAIQRDEIVRRLVASGLFDANRRAHLSPVPLRLGVVTSATSAAWADFRHELERSGHGFQVVLADVRVQGDQAVGMISRAITTLGERDDIDVVVVIRGGGARTDLATFDAEPIALAICRSGRPVFTGLGHEVDRSVADDVAHSALKTPTACAVSLVEHVRVHLDRCEEAWSRISALATGAVSSADVSVIALAHGVGHHTVAAVGRAGDRLDHRAERIFDAARRRLDAAVVRTDGAADVVVRRAPLGVVAAARSLDVIDERLRLLDPVHVLARGWTITRDASGRVVRDVSAVAPGATLVTQLASGLLTSTVTAAVPAVSDDPTIADAPMDGAEPPRAAESPKGPHRE
jgi:exodeoxyribonuclease VII large subunit